ncbi:hypothetical protein GCM10007301_27560 [Azorhizobium oxalatiphilum]|uniref:Exo-alpha-sialidase n=1 Tax=Azorhizobium oxalatiphilum TaxID=980631 RepID=A0A917C0P5_9HYPH|nr:hypothetical protein [Azorhizobium oxalatiphilum]GGF66347.1 hypothetical protein GCM10007301_27560 [Azorhizobium oxalatiphilum]
MTVFTPTEARFGWRPRAASCKRALALSLALLLAPVAASAIELQVAGRESILFDQRTQACDANDLPDAPARAFRNAEGQMVLFAPNFRNRALVGPDIRHLARDCAVRFAAKGASDPNLLDDRTWLHGFYTKDGTNVFAFASASFIPYRHKERCNAGSERTACWRNGVAALVSHDGGKTFTDSAPPPAHVLMPPVPYSPDQKNPAGFISATNIVTYKGDLYSIVWRRDAEARRSRNCLVRAKDGNVDRWEVWIGDSFAPLAERTPQGWKVERTDCAAVGQGLPSIRGLVFHPASGTFIAVFQMQPRGKQQGESGFYTATSKDMVQWSEPKLLSAQPLRDGLEDAGTFNGYPALIDGQSPDRNFGSVGDTADLVFVRLLPDPKTKRTRQLIALPLRITP